MSAPLALLPQPLMAYYRILDQSLDPGWEVSLIDNLTSLEDAELRRLRAAVEAEMKKRNLALTVGAAAEELAIRYFNETPGCPNLFLAPVGTANVDALSRKGERYSIKGICDAKKTGTIYPDADDREKQLFEFLLIVKVSRDLSLEAIYELSWSAFVALRSWDKRMNAWYVGASRKTLALAKLYAAGPS
jgi:hypothetical protein